MKENYVSQMDLSALVLAATFSPYNEHECVRACESV